MKLLVPRPGSNQGADHTTLPHVRKEMAIAFGTGPGEVLPEEIWAAMLGNRYRRYLSKFKL